MTQRTRFILYLTDDVAYTIIGLAVLARWLIYPEGQGDPCWFFLHLVVVLYVARSSVRLWICATNREKYHVLNQPRN